MCARTSSANADSDRSRANWRKSSESGDMPTPITPAGPKSEQKKRTGSSDCDRSSAGSHARAAYCDIAVRGSAKIDSAPMHTPQLTERAMEIRRRFAEFEKARHGRTWTREEIMQGFVVDVGDLMKLVMAKAGAR